MLRSEAEHLMPVHEPQGGLIGLSMQDSGFWGWNFNMGVLLAWVNETNNLDSKNTQS